MAQTPVLPPNRHVPYKKGGWGAALLTIAATVGAYLAAYYIHTQTYRDPRDVMMRQVGEQPTPRPSIANTPAPAAGNTAP